MLIKGKIGAKNQALKYVGCSYLSRDARKNLKKKLKRSRKHQENRDWKKDQSN